MAKRKLNVLIACEESQTICKEFRRLGHNAYSCDLQTCSGGHPEWHFLGDCLSVIRIGGGNLENGEYAKFDGDIDLLIAHPPCTYMSKAGARWMYPKAGQLSQERYRLAMEAKQFFMQFYNSNVKHVAIENPVPLKCVGLPPFAQKVQPYEYGEPYSKATLLWLHGLPKLQPTDILTQHTPWMPSNTSGFSRGQGGSRGIAHDQRTASKTFQGIARAIAQQWSEYIINNEQ